MTSDEGLDIRDERLWMWGVGCGIVVWGVVGVWCGVLWDCGVGCEIVV